MGAQADVRNAAVYLRADHGITSLALLGAGTGGASLMLRCLATSAPALGASAAVALCCPGPAGPRPDELSALPAPDASDAIPLLLLYDKLGERDDTAAALAREHLGLDNGSSSGDDDATAAAQAVAPPPAPSSPKTVNGHSTAAAAPESISKLRRLRVGELRQRLAACGAPTDGLKPALVERLYARQQQAQQQASDSADAEVAEPSDGKKESSQRQRPPSAPTGGDLRGRSVMQFAGLHDAACGGLGDESADDDEEGVQRQATGEGAKQQQQQMDGAANPEEGMTEGGEGEDGLIFAEAFLNLHLGRA